MERSHASKRRGRERQSERLCLCPSLPPSLPLTHSMYTIQDRSQRARTQTHLPLATTFDSPPLPRKRRIMQIFYRRDLLQNCAKRPHEDALSEKRAVRSARLVSRGAGAVLQHQCRRLLSGFLFHCPWSHRAPSHSKAVQMLPTKALTRLIPWLLKTNQRTSGCHNSATELINSRRPALHSPSSLFDLKRLLSTWYYHSTRNTSGL
jgi:hypothetical protein